MSPLVDDDRHAQQPQSPTPDIASRPPSQLDRLLYNFYTKTVAVITANRLTHWHDLGSFGSHQLGNDSALDVFSHDAHGDPRPAIEAASPATDPPGTKLNTWFSLPLPELDVFKDEVRLWRHISAFVPPPALEASIETPATDAIAVSGAFVPPMTLDVVLDPSMLTSGQSLLLRRGGSGSTKDSPADSQGAPVSVRMVSAESGDGEASDDFQRSIHQRPIVLERWRVDFNVFPPDSPPDLPTLYSRCSSHFRSLHSLSKMLPTQQLYRRIRQARLAQAKRRGSATSFDQGTSRDLDQLLQLGCRLGTGEAEGGGGEDDDEVGAAEAQEIGLKHRLFSRSDQYPTLPEGEDGELETSIHGFSPIITPLGSLTVSVEYRNGVDFRVQGATTPPSQGVSRNASTRLTPAVASIDLRPDEDYFRPKPSHTSDQSKAAAGGVEVPSSVRPSSSAAAAVGQASAPPTPAGAQPIPSSSAARASPVPETSSSASSGNASPTPSLLGTSASARTRPVAGLSSLRHQSSIAAMGAATGGQPVDLPANPSNTSGLAAALSGSYGTADPAFLTGHSRRSSVGERRFRTLSGVASGDRPSPPSPSMGASPVPLRPNLPVQLRMGSYSPSSPSPLAQQLSMNNSQSQTAATPRSTSASASSGGGGASSSAHRASLPLNASFSLRSIFQDYGPKAAGSASVSALPASRRHSSTAPVRPTMRREGSGGGSSVISSEERASPSAAATTTATRPAQTPSVAPQMIQRYSRTPSYRQDRRPISGSIGEVEGEGSAGLSSVEGGAGSYSRSWQARTEARQAMIANAMQRGSLGSTGSVSPGGIFAARDSPPGSSVPRPFPSSAAAASGSAPRSLKHKGSIDELVAMIESRPQLLQDNSTTRRQHRATAGSSQQPHPPPSPSASSPLVSARPLPTIADNGSAPFVRRPPSGAPGPGGYTQPEGSAAAATPPGSHTPSNAVLLSRSAVDEMLAKMSMSVNRLTSSPSVGGGGSGGGGSPASGGSGSTSGIATKQRDDAAGVGGVTTGTMAGADAHTSPGVVGGGASRAVAATIARPPSYRALSSLASRRSGMGMGMMNRSQSSLELYSPEPSAAPGGGSGSAGGSGTHSGGRSSALYDDADLDPALAGFEEEEPAGRLELHSEPSTPHLHAQMGSRPGTGHGGAAVGMGIGLGSSPGHGHGHGLHRDVEAAMGMNMGMGVGMGMGGSTSGPTDAERLRSFGEELGSTRGRRTQSPWGGRKPPMHAAHAHGAPTVGLSSPGTSLGAGAGLAAGSAGSPAAGAGAGAGPTGMGVGAGAGTAGVHAHALAMSPSATATATGPLAYAAPRGHHPHSLSGQQHALALHARELTREREQREREGATRRLHSHSTSRASSPRMMGPSFSGPGSLSAAATAAVSATRPGMPSFALPATALEEQDLSRRRGGSFSSGGVRAVRGAQLPQRREASSDRERERDRDRERDRERETARERDWREYQAMRQMQRDW